MGPLIEIKNVPIEIEMKISRAELKYTRGTADLEISKGQSGMQIKSKPIKIDMDTFQSQGGIMPTPLTQASTVPDAVSPAEAQGTYQATAAQQGQGFMLNAKLDQHILGQLAQKQISQKPIAQEPVVQPEQVMADAQDPEMNIRFEMDQLNFAMRLSNQEFEFTPGDIEFTVSQRPEVVITYIGGPIYVPPSSDPNYEPVDVKA